MVERKQKVYVTEEKFYIIRMLYEQKPIKEMASMTNLSYQTVVKTIKKLLMLRVK